MAGCNHGLPRAIVGRMAQQVSIPVRFFGPRDDQLPLGEYVATRKQYFDALIEVAKRAREYGPAHKAFQDNTLECGANFVEALRALAKSVEDLEKVEKYVAELGEGTALPT